MFSLVNTYQYGGMTFKLFWAQENRCVDTLMETYLGQIII